MGDKVNTPESYDLVENGTYESHREMVGHVGGAWDTHGDWVFYESMVEELHGAALWVESLEAELRTLRADYEQMEGHLTRQRDQIQTLRADKERLDWLDEVNEHGPARVSTLADVWWRSDEITVRAAIDAARGK